jgi:V8-like Glu-specific endopeptidase
MNIELQSAIYPVESSEQNNNTVGTGFIIYQTRQISYFLTCAHVVESIGKGSLQIDGIAATIEAMGAPDDLDLAILAVKGLPLRPVIEMMSIGKEGDPVTITGIYDYGQHRSRKSIRGYLDSQSSLKKPKAQGKWVKAWELKLETNDYLQPGYSGSPVMHDTSRKVIAVVSHRRGLGDKGLAISVEAINEL